MPVNGIIITKMLKNRSMEKERNTNFGDKRSYCWNKTGRKLQSLHLLVVYESVKPLNLMKSAFKKKISQI
jgi:hypothetical protein